MLVIRPADGSLKGECAQEKKDRDQMGSLSRKSCLISRSVQTPHTEGHVGSGFCVHLSTKNDARQ